MMALPESTSAEAFDRYVTGRVIAASNGWKDLSVRIYSEYLMNSCPPDAISFSGAFMMKLSIIANPAPEKQRPVGSTTLIQVASVIDQKTVGSFNNESLR